MQVNIASHAKAMKRAIALCRHTKLRLRHLSCCTLAILFVAFVVLSTIGGGYLHFTRRAGDNGWLSHTYGEKVSEVLGNSTRTEGTTANDQPYNISFYIDPTIDRVTAQKKLFYLGSTYWPVQFFGTREDTFHVHFVYNKAFVGVADLLPTLPPDVRYTEGLGSQLQASPEPEKVLEKYIILNEHYTEVSRLFVEKFVRAMMDSASAKQRLLVYLPTSAVASFTEMCLRQQAAILLPPGTDVSQRRKFVLISGVTDLTASMSFADVRWSRTVHVVRDLLQHPLLAHWFAQNCDLRHAKFTCLPIGIDYHQSVLRAHPPQSVTATQQELSILDFYMGKLNTSRLLPADIRTSRTELRPYWQEAVVKTALSPGQELVWSSLEQLSLPNHTAALGDEVQAGVIVTPIRPPSDPRVISGPDLLSRVALVRGRAAGGAAEGRSTRLYMTVPTLFAQAQQSWSFGDPRRILRVIVAFNAEHAPYLRVPVKNYLYDHMHDIAVNAAGSRDKLWSMMQQYAFVASPVGVGYDCHRTWEALAMGCIPIVYHPDVFTDPEYLNHFTPYRDNISELHPDAPLDVFRDLPVIVVRDFAKEVTLENLVRWREEVYRNLTEGRYRLEKLFNQYWIDRFYSL